MMSPRFILVILTTIGALSSATADAASLSTNLSIRSPGVSNTNAYTPSGHGGYPTPKEPPPLPRSSANDPFDSSSNLNPGGGNGGGIKPNHKPNLQ